MAWGDGYISREPRKDGRYQGALRIEGRRVTVYGKSRREVQQKLAKLRRDRDAGRTPQTDRTTVAEYLAEWLESVATRIRPNTHRAYEQLVRLHAVPGIGSKRLALLAPSDLDRLYRGRIKAGLAPRTVGQLHRVLHHALKDALRARLIMENVADLVSPPRVERYEAATLDMAQAHALLVAALRERLAAVYVLAITMGMRQGEILALRWDGVNLSAGTLAVRQTLHRRGYRLGPTKSHRSARPLGLPAAAAEALSSHRARQYAEQSLAGADWQDTGLVFTTETGGPVNADALRRSFYRMLDTAGLPRVRFHDLRHTFSTLSLEGGAPIAAVSAALGHSQIGTTLNIYTHATQTADAQLAAQIDRIFGTLLAPPPPEPGND